MSLISRFRAWREARRERRKMDAADFDYGRRLAERRLAQGDTPEEIERSMSFPNARLPYERGIRAALKVARRARK